MIWVLFVDDDPAVLEGLQNRRRPLRRPWTMSFVGGGEQAQVMPAGANFDVIVCDMRMPHSDGAELFRRVRQEHPQVVRMVLSGHLGQDDLLRALPLAHQILTSA